jgi:hypothetical protein
MADLLVAAGVVTTRNEGNHPVHRFRIAAAITAAAAAALIPAISAGASVSAVTARPAGPPPAGQTVTFGSARAMPSVHLPPTHLPHPMLLRDGSYTSDNWAGYVITSRGGHILPQVNDTFIVPDVNCADSPIGSSGFADSSYWAGFDGFADATVEQEGVDAYCTSSTGPATYYTWYEMYPLDAVVEGTVSPGDAVSVESSRSGANYVLSLDDRTDASGFTTTQACPSGSVCDDTQAEVITEDPGGAVPAGIDLPDFALDQQTAISAKDYLGATGTFANNDGGKIWLSQTIRMVDPSDLIMAAPGPLYGGQAFYVTWFRGS